MNSGAGSTSNNAESKDEESAERLWEVVTRAHIENQKND
jgi:hypothetical protein